MFYVFYFKTEIFAKSFLILGGRKMKSKAFILIILLITRIMFSASMEDYINIEELPKLLMKLIIR